MSNVRIGQIIGSYQLVRQLGTGGMGTVYEAIQTVIGRRAAIKILHSQYDSQPQSALRFLNEARAVNLVQHPGLVDIYELGHLEDGTGYIIMELLVGESLATRIDRGRCAQGDAIRIARQIASTLAAVHAKGIIHRDLKPDNVMLVRDLETQGGERVKVLDFGIAKILHDDDADGKASKRTRTGVVMGTPRYMAPEQCRGSGVFDARADVYALGALLFELLTGRPPFIAEGLGELMYQHLSITAPLLSAFDPSAPAELTALIQAMLAKTPEERPWMNQIALTLEMLGAPKAAGSGTIAYAGPLPTLSSERMAASRNWSTLGQAAGERPRTRRGQRSPWPLRTRHPRALGAALALATALLVVLGLVIRAPPKPPPPPPPPLVRVSQPPVTLPAAQVPAPPRPRRVRWTIKTTPAGATVRLSSGEVWGVTPVSRTRPAQAGTETLHLLLAGYGESQIVVDGDSDEDIDEQLKRRARQTHPDLKKNDGETNDDPTVY